MTKDFLDTPDNDTLATESEEALVPLDLNAESARILNQIIEASDAQQTQDLVQLFNNNQNKKTLVRIDKLSGLQDNLVDQFVKRIAERPDAISNKELMDGLKVVQDIIERGQRQVCNPDAPQTLIQINQQDNSVNIGNDSGSALNRESRERVKNAIMGLLQNLPATTVVPTHETEISENLDTSEEDPDE